MAPALAAAIPSLIKWVGGLLDQHIPDKDQAAKIKAEITTRLIEKGDRELEAAASIIRTEAGSGWLTSSWRPLTMLTFVALIVAKWLGLTAPGVTEAVELELLAIVKVGLGGYVIGRSAEKVVERWKD